ncbi:MAG TPA: dCTP deaminase [Gemmataceae bacterium]|nr:dCTP deaminase [Gemmataceae bacterium]
MILCDREIELALEQQRLIIKPDPDPKFMDSMTVDLRLDGTLDQWEFPESDASIGQSGLRFRPGLPNFRFSDLENKYTKPTTITETQGYDLAPLPPRNFVLGWTLERIYLPHTSRLCARVEGKSSMARLGLGVHVTAPTIHAGFGFNPNNQADQGTRLRLEIWNVGPLPIELVKGMRICQLIVEEVREVPKADYQGQFNIQGPEPRT